MPSASSEQIIIDRLTTSEEEKLDIQIPEDVKPGFHELIIEIYDDNGTIKKSLIDFCKTSDGEIRWDNSCPSLTQSNKYSPIDDASSVVDSMVILFALATAAASAQGKNKAQDEKENESEEEDREQGDIASADSGKLKLHEREEKWGDQSFTWRAPLTSKLDSIGLTLAPKIFKLSPSLARSFVDSSYLRAIFGSLSLLIYPIAVWVGILAAREDSVHPVVPSAVMFLALITLGILDSFAGLVAGVAFTVATFVEGNIATQDQLLTTAGILAIAFTPSLIASAFRPLRRVADDKRERWERLKDYALVTVLMGWAISKIVAALNGLSGEKLDIANDAKRLGIYAALILLARLIGEEVATYAYPKRLLSTTPQLPDPKIRQRFTTLILKTLILFVVAAPFVGVNNQLYLGLAIFMLPAAATILFKEKLPESKLIGKLIPNGALKIIVMIVVGSLFASFIESLYSNPEDFLKWSFALLAIPGALLTILSIFAQSPDIDWKDTLMGRRINFLGGFVIYGLILAAIAGRDLAELVAQPMFVGIVALVLLMAGLSAKVWKRA